MMNSQNPKLAEGNKWISNKTRSPKTVRELVTPHKEQLHLPSLHEDEVTSFGQDRSPWKPATSLQGRKNMKINEKQRQKKKKTSLQLCYAGTGTIPGIHQVRQPWIPDHSLLSLSSVTGRLITRLDILLPKPSECWIPSKNRKEIKKQISPTWPTGQAFPKVQGQSFSVNLPK